jgi:steroid delta-isomerase-like uncharacterized protein
MRSPSRREPIRAIEHLDNAHSSIMATISDSQILARLRIVDEHVRLENEHNLDGIMRTFGPTARYDDESWGAHYVGHDEVRAFYGELLRALPDMQISVLRRHATNDAVVLEVVIRGQHLGFWRGLPATGRRLEFPLCGIFTFDESDRLAGERIYYDRATMLRQLGLFHEPERMPGRVAAMLMHPVTMLRIMSRSIFRR